MPAAPFVSRAGEGGTPENPEEKGYKNRFILAPVCVVLIFIHGAILVTYPQPDVRNGGSGCMDPRVTKPRALCLVPAEHMLAELPPSAPAKTHPQSPQLPSRHWDTTE